MKIALALLAAMLLSGCAQLDLILRDGYLLCENKTCNDKEAISQAAAEAVAPSPPSTDKPDRGHGHGHGHHDKDYNKD
jgi:hypothetical protein